MPHAMRLWTLQEGITGKSHGSHARMLMRNSVVRSIFPCELCSPQREKLRNGVHDIIEAIFL